MLSRRKFVKTGLVGTAALAIGGGFWHWLAPSGYPLLPGEAAIGLRTAEFCVARAIVATLVPGDGAMPNGVELGIHQQIDEQAWSADPATRRDLGNSLTLVEHVPPVLGHFARFTSLSHSARSRVFELLLSSRRDLLAQVAVSLKQMVELLYYSNERVWPLIGYDGPWIQEPRPPASALAYAKLLAERSGRAA